MLPALSLSQLFAAVLNMAVKANPDADTTVLEGRSFAIAIDELPQDIAITIENAQIIAVPEEAVSNADVIVSGNIKAILEMIKNQDDGLEDDALYISGKISTAKRFQQFLGTLGMNWQVFLTQFMSEDKANKLAEAIEQSLHVAKGGAEQLGEGLKNYIMHDKQWLVRQVELDELSRGIAALHQRIDELSASLSR